MNLFNQLTPEWIDSFRSMGAKYVVSIYKEGPGVIEEVRSEMSSFGYGLSSLYPGGDSFDNPYCCIALFNDLRDATALRDYFALSDIRKISDD